MKEITGNMFDMKADAYCITTNGIVKANGRAVMGAGVALLTVRKFPECDKFLGDFIGKNGHVVGVFYIADSTDLISFPTKHHWKDPSDIKLIEKSANELNELIYKNMYNKVILPRPGCANGGLDWEDVKKIIAPILDDRVVIISL
jgi:hypothetical protein